jgi:hypothetical protein
MRHEKCNGNQRSLRRPNPGQGVIIEFDDGISALYSASLLRSMLPKAERLKSQPKAASFATANKPKNAGDLTA